MRAARIEVPATMDPDDIAPRWQRLDDDARSDAYSPSTMVADRDLTPFLDSYATKSAAAYAAFDVKTVSYGPKPSNTFDLVTPPPSDDPGRDPRAPDRPPIHVYVHGGYWQLLSKHESMFAAGDTLERGWAFAAVDYTLAPHATLDEIVAETVAAIREIRAQADAYGYDADSMLVSGSSAGAHLTAMATLHLEFTARPAAVALMSGVYELESLVGTYINDAVGLDVAAARSNSPLHRDLDRFPPAIVTWGESETDEFKRQSLAFAQALKSAPSGIVDAFEVANVNHFDIAELVLSPATLGDRVFALADAAFGSQPAG